MIASYIGFLALTVVGAIQWLSRPAMAVLPEAQAARVEPTRRTDFRYAAYLVGCLPLLVAAYGATAGRRRYRVVTVDVPMANLPLGLDDLRIVHLSDLHIGDFMPRTAIRRVADLANTAQPDLAVLTGDLITSERDPLQDCIAELSRLRAIPTAASSASRSGAPVEPGQFRHAVRGRSVPPAIRPDGAYLKR